MKSHNKKVVKHNMDLRFCVSYIFMIKVSHTHIYCLFVSILIKLILRCRMDLPGPTTLVGTRTDYSVGPWDYPACAARHLMA
jgi:hypothetical protein